LGDHLKTPAPKANTEEFMEKHLTEQYNALKKQVLETYFGKMNDMQKRAVFLTDGPLLILAGAGSGKTTVLISRIENMVRFGGAYHSCEPPFGAGEEQLRLMQAYLDGGAVDPEELVAAVAHHPVKPWNILAITFTNKAAGELRARLEQTLGKDAHEVQASTFHSLCVRILRREIKALGYGRSFTIYDTDDSLRIVKDGLKVASLDEKMFTPRSVLAAISRAKDGMMTPAGMRGSAVDDYRVEQIARVYDYYQKTLKDANAVDFDDIIVLTVRLFEQNPRILEYYQNRYRYIMVDEYQDTNHTQYRLVSMLAAGHHNLCVVGDDDQSIYKFRGATIENILSFEEQFENAAIIRLEQNYRSTQSILSAANKVIEHNMARKGKNLWTSADDGELVQVLRLRDEVEESRLLADSILENVKGGAAFSNHAILYRMNAQSNSVERALVKNAIPYRIVGGLRFYERKEIKDIVAYLSVLVNPGDSLRLLRVINEPKRGIGGSTLAGAQQIAQDLGVSLFEVISESESYPALAKKSAALAQFSEMMRDLAEMAEEGPLDELLDSLLERSGYLHMLEAQGFEGVGRLENIMELKSNIMKYQQENEEPSLAGFLEEIALYTDLDSYDAGADSVVLMTIHSAKGLEFPYVVIVGMDEGIFPGRSAMSHPAEVEEERRLAYVAITRAKQRLTITSAERRMIFGQTVFSRPSRFIAEIPDEFKDFQDKTIIKRDPADDNYKPTKRRGVPTASSTTIGVGAAPESARAAVNVGDQVSHKVFGEGKVISARPMGNDVLVEIDFGKGGVKKVMANFARLTKI